MKIFITLVLLVIAGYFGYSYYKNNFDKSIKPTIESQIVQDPQQIDSNVNLNQDYKAHIYKVSILNKTDDQYTLYPYDSFRLKSGSNYYDIVIDGAVEEYLQTTTLGKDQSVVGQISFYAPKNRNIELQFREDVDSDWRKI